MGASGMTTHVSKEQERLGRKAKDTYNPFPRVPTKKPSFTLSDLKKAIPPHCFYRSIIRSFSYLVKDLLIATILLYVALTLFPNLPSPFHLIVWPLYWFAQGSILFGFWVIGHECGHNAFSKFSALDNVIGFVLHSFLLIPFFSFKYSHRRHHSNTGSLEREEGHVSIIRSNLNWFFTIRRNSFGFVFIVIIALTLGWPMYLLFNLSGRSYKRYTNHFDPYGPIYNDRERAQIFVSDAGIITMLFIFYRLSSTFTISWLIRIYGMPLLVANAWITIITFLQHTHPALPRYDSSEWDWLRGALSTVDRDYGFFNLFFHNITDTHVLHHIFSTIPHYHAMEATKAIRPVLGDYYCMDDTPIVKAVWRDVTECIFVEAELDKGKPKGVLWFRNDV